MPEHNSEERTIAQMDDALAELAVAAWRMCVAFEQGAVAMQPAEQRRYTNQVRYFLGSFKEAVEKGGLRVETHAGVSFGPGLPVSALNLQDFDAAENLVVDRCIEPTILGPAGIVRMGTVLVKRAQE